ncbi:MFS transporter [Leuconostoc citreum]|uniref:MFS transporter n=1 Tax=Leuconostoc citreum TaxID=33964 RepID=UPI001C1F69DA|nr:MFS transporter [Leuconostoc citreum]MBU7450602.1 MFS transporter [Leuconostoc citreum]
MNKLKYVLPILLVGNILCMMDVSIMTIVIPEIQTAFSVSLSDLSWTVNVYTIVFAALIIPFGRLAERCGQHRIVFLGLMTFGFGSLMTGLAPNLAFMLVARGIQSIGAAIIIPTSMVIALDLSNADNRNKVVAALAGSQGLAVALGPAVGGFVAQYLDWRWVFYINLPFIIVLLVIYPFVLNIRRETRRAVKIDWLGASLSCIFLTTLSLGLIKANDWGWTSLTIVTMFIASGLTFILFIVQELHTPSPMINLSLFKNRNFTASGIALLLSNYLLGGMVILIPTLLTKVQGETELNAALLITPYSVSVMLTVIMTSLLIKRINQRILIGLGFIIIAGSYLLIAHLNLSQGYHRLIIADILLGIGYGLVAATANILVASDFHGRALTDSQSVANILRQVGFIIAIALFTSVLSTNINTAKQNTITYAHQQIQTLDIQQALKNKMLTKVDQKLSSNDSQSNRANNNTMSISVDTTKIKHQALDTAYQKQLQLAATQLHTNIDNIPEPVKHIIYQKVSNVALPRIEQDIQQTKNQLNTTISHIKDHFIIESRQAFMSVYQVMIIVPILSLLLLFVFKKMQPKR